MPVIGRLDDQVDAVLISPLSKRSPPERKPATGEQPVQHPSQTPTADRTTDVESKTERETLPVWLL